MVSPKKSLICVLAMSTAMPLVKPMTTGRGMYLTAVPRPVTPSRTSTTPAIMVHMKSPSRPCLLDDAGDDDDERPGRAADLGARSAQRRDQEAGDDRAVDARLRRDPDAIANAIASGNATRPTVTPANGIGDERAAV